MKKQIICLIYLICLVAPSVYSQQVSVDSLMEYNKWRFSNKRVYLNDEEHIYRQQIFFENLQRIKEHDKKQSTYTVGLNQFSDMPKDEYVAKMLNNKFAQFGESNRNLEEIEYFEPSKLKSRGLATNPASFDWRTKGAVTPVKNQGECGSCWTFSVAGTLESFSYIKTGKSSIFSEQQLLDCVGYAGFKSDGCKGGFQEEGYKYTMKYGIVDQSSYKYVGAQGKCKVTEPSKGFYIKSFKRVKNTITAMKEALLITPVSITIDATNWDNYKGGVFDDNVKQLDKINQTMQLFQLDTMLMIIGLLRILMVQNGVRMVILNQPLVTHVVYQFIAQFLLSDQSNKLNQLLFIFQNNLKKTKKLLIKIVFDLFQSVFIHIIYYFLVTFISQYFNKISDYYKLNLNVFLIFFHINKEKINSSQPQFNQTINE